MAREDSGEQSVSLGVLDQAKLSLGLDFANESGWRTGLSQEERLAGYRKAVDWARQAGVLEHAVAEGLLARACAQPEEVPEALDRIVALRKALYRVFSAIARDLAPDHADIQVLHAELGQALVHLRLAAAPGLEGHRFVWTWAGMEDQLTSLLWPLARAAASLLTSSQVTRVRACADDACGWLFIDHSKNGSRRWCDMSDCGNRAKARRYRARKKGEPAC